MKRYFIIVLSLFLSSQMHGQCMVKKTGKVYGFFRVTNFKEKICWLSEPFAYNVVNNKMENYNAIKQCFIEKVNALGGNVVSDIDEFGQEKVVWLDNPYDPENQPGFSYNWYLPSRQDCIKYIKSEIQYKTNVGIQVKIVRMFSNGEMETNDL